MLKFKPLSINDKALFEKYIKPYKFFTCDFSFIDLYMWRNLFHVEYCIYDDALIIRKKEFDEPYFFLEPLGYRMDNLEKILNELKDYKNGEHLIKYAESHFIKDLKALLPDKYIIEEDRDNFDYIYDTKRLISLSSNSLSKKRNNYNHFVKNNIYDVKIYNESLLKDCIYIIENWYKNCPKLHFLSHEIEAVHDVLLNFSILNLQCMVVYVYNEPCAFSIGEILNENMAVIHVEKADRSIRGLYSFINKRFAETFYKDILYINREEDLGIENLRKAKLSYNPIFLEPKYIIK
ncbi:hypothetical protein SAMN05443428_12218 [Caloramator quimbayensis]|uniref:Phosphatidylglycerol lysyltransferase C-terminal domain-containing protein n=1 Tax=Caloramator quimbayensis TaxID=1147123 RepID=A0A1T4Y5B0_9CLOT|nr:phosphatidylglycerol lysyltransferase domain-containing protein [Caloramator quimbayensis]SKA96708.1 hypothetical protein SAMN05443428_12218 [Caloramator quimbayensis]